MIMLEFNAPPDHEVGCDCIECEWGQFLAKHVYDVPFSNVDIAFAREIARLRYGNAFEQLESVDRPGYSDWHLLRLASSIMPLWSRMAAPDKLPLVATIDLMVQTSAISSMLDIGCSVGEIPIFFQSTGRVPRVSAVDHSTKVLGHAKELAKKAEADIDFRVQRAEDLSYHDHTFDLVLLNRVIHYVTEWQIVIREAARVLAPGGIMIVTNPANETVVARTPRTIDDIHREIRNNSMAVEGPAITGEPGRRTATFFGHKAA